MTRHSTFKLTTCAYTYTLDPLQMFVRVNPSVKRGIEKGRERERSWYVNTYNVSKPEYVIKQPPFWPMAHLVMNDLVKSRETSEFREIFFTLLLPYNVVETCLVILFCTVTFISLLFLAATDFFPFSSATTIEIYCQILIICLFNF